MQQLSLLTHIKWARPAARGSGIVARIAPGGAAELRAIFPELQLIDARPCSPDLYVLLRGCDGLLDLTDEPESHGSQTDGVLLPW
ncbi:hypothetical protein PN498_28280 [Oscillatoria sp. CS-180]|uniref:hypothetical protein n=1 Tax=Oscillatoria sp. CS-180 TaxID=3021720 RepID=UPI00232DEEBB|nr:hypothetical protein [Oscillatoria sp. CS-180]MDB9529917.1 hypothetical protein [Oscillatoria sp. CS-180]